MSVTSSEADIWERIIDPRGPMSRDAARRILTLALTEEDRMRASELAELNRQGKLSDDEEADLDNLCRVGTLLSILKVRARRVLKSRAQDA